jgi:HK97 family phage prohead protease
MKKYFVANTETVNAYGFRVLTEGIDLSRFKKNPVALYNHNALVGRWGEIKKEGNLVVGDITFSQRPEAQMVAKDVQDGIVTSVSIGIKALAFSDAPEDMMPGQSYPTITKSELLEISLVDIPANADAVGLKLYTDAETKTETNIIQLMNNNPQNGTAGTTQNGTAGTSPAPQNGTGGAEQEQVTLLKDIQNSLNNLNKAVLSLSERNNGTVQAGTGGTISVPQTGTAGTEQKGEIEQLRAELEQMKAERLTVESVLKMSAQLSGAAAETRKDWTFSDWQKKDSVGLAAMREKNPEQYNDLLKTLKTGRK